MSKATKNAEQPAAQQKPETKAEPAITSENLTKLQDEYQKAGESMQKEKFNSPAWIDAKTKLFTLESQIKTEEAKIKFDIAQAKIAEERNARVAMATNLIDAVLSAYGITSRVPEKDAQFAQQEEIVKTELLAKYAKSTPSKKATGNATGSRGAITAAIRELIAPMYAGATRETVAEIGKQARHEAIAVNGFNDGTANATIVAYERELGLKD